RLGPPSCGRDCHTRYPVRCARGQGCDSDDPDRVRRRRRPGQAWSRYEPSPAGRQRHRNQFFSQEMIAKRLGLLHELVPKAVRVAVLVNPANAATAETTMREAQEAARAFGLQIDLLNTTTIGEIDAAFATFARERPDALFVAADGFLVSRR